VNDTRRTAAVAVALALAIVTGCLPWDSYDQEDLQRDVDAIRDSGTVGVQARVTSEDGDVLVATSGVADLDTREPVPVNGHYRIGSNTKTFTATVVLQLAGEGELSLDDTIERHLPGVVEGNDNDGSTIAIRDLLRHTSGIHDYNNDDDWDPFATSEIFQERRFEHYAPEDLVAVAMRHPPEFPAGTQHGYSNTNYLVAGMIIEAVTDNPWGQEVTDRIIEPLGLEGTTVPDGAMMPEPHAKGYHQFEPNGPLVDTTLLDPSAGGAGGAIISTPADMTRFFSALLAGDLLTPEMLAEMQDTVPSGDGRYGLGLGWSPLSCGDGYWRHGGAVPGYASWEGFREDGARGVVLSMNSLHSYGDTRRDAGQADAASELIDNALCDR
jgi:D-alanyl-D-alanine carboxypeptidase